MSKASSYIGQHIHNLKIINVKFENGRHYADCECDCGKIFKTRLDSITSGRTKSCGCLSQYKAKDITGLVSGKLKAIKCVGTDGSGAKLWLCECECGKTTVTRASNIIAKEAQSCGCTRSEKNVVNLEKAKQATQKYYDIGTNATIEYDNPSALNTTGVKNVSYSKSKNRYMVQMEYKKKHYALGGYETLEEAKKIRDFFADARRNDTFEEEYQKWKSRV